MAIRGILLDTNAYAAFKHGTGESIEILRHAPLIGMNSVVLGELLCGFALGKYETINKQELKLFLSFQRVKLLSINDNTAEYYSKVYTQLKHKGKPIPTNDMWVAATAIENDLAIFSYDIHFQSIDGIITGNRLKDFLE